MSVLVTGSSRGLGRALALVFAACGHDVIIHGRDRAALEEVDALIRVQARKCRIVEGDLREGRTRFDLIEAAHSWRVDVLVNNAGVYSHGPFMNLSAVDVQDVVTVNLIAPMLLILGIFPFMTASGRGTIVNISSTAGRIPNDMEAVYCASKHGLAGFTRSFQNEAIRAGVRILTVYLGAMDTAMTGHRDRSKLIRVDEAAAAIVEACTDYMSLQIREIYIGRKIY